MFGSSKMKMPNISQYTKEGNMLLDHPLFLSFSLLGYLYSFPVDCIPHPKFPWTQSYWTKAQDLNPG